MAAYNQLMVARLDDIEGQDRVCLKKGILKANFLPGPFIAGPYPRTSRPVLQGNSSRRLPLITLLPPELLTMVLGNLEPIWIFQLEAAYPETVAVTANLNFLWYNRLPPALFIEPEHFQNEGHVRDVRRGPSRGNAKIGPTDNLPTRRLAVGFAVPNTVTINGQVRLPAVTDMSDLSTHAECSSDTQHPRHIHHYPLIPTPEHTYRIRDLALGGPFQAEIDYRREIVGFLHYRQRCQICAEPCSGTDRFHRIDFDILFCLSCYQKYTLTQAQIQKIPGLDRLLAGDHDPTWAGHKRYTTNAHPQWRPLVDEVLRKTMGIDFETACAKQAYLDQLLATSNMLKHPIEANRRMLRHGIVEAAKRIWDFGTDASEIDENIQCARSTFAPTEILHTFLFPARSLDENLLLLPYDRTQNWLADPTMQLYSREILTRSEEWKHEAAIKMIRKLVKWHASDYYRQGRGGTVTAWVEAADQHHLKRMEQTMTADMAIQKLKEDHIESYFPTPTPNNQSPAHPPTHKFRRLGVILTKLLIPPMQPLRLKQLSDREEILAKEVYFKKLLKASCAACPLDGKLAGSRGSEGVIKHFRELHARTYWHDEDWFLIG